MIVFIKSARRHKFPSNKAHEICFSMDRIAFVLPWDGFEIGDSYLLGIKSYQSCGKMNIERYVISQKDAHTIFSAEIK